MQKCMRLIYEKMTFESSNSNFQMYKSDDLLNGEYKIILKKN